MYAVWCFPMARSLIMHCREPPLTIAPMICGSPAAPPAIQIATILTDRPPHTHVHLIECFLRSASLCPTSFLKRKALPRSGLNNGSGYKPQNALKHRSGYKPQQDGPRQYKQFGLRTTMAGRAASRSTIRTYKQVQPQAANMASQAASRSDRQSGRL